MRGSRGAGNTRPATNIARDSSSIAAMRDELTIRASTISPSGPAEKRTIACPPASVCVLATGIRGALASGAN